MGSQVNHHSCSQLVVLLLCTTTCYYNKWVIVQVCKNEFNRIIKSYIYTCFLHFCTNWINYSSILFLKDPVILIQSLIKINLNCISYYLANSILKLIRFLSTLTWVPFFNILAWKMCGIYQHYKTNLTNLLSEGNKLWATYTLIAVA